jgi:hypothetical protein
LRGAVAGPGRSHDAEHFLRGGDERAWLRARVDAGAAQQGANLGAVIDLVKQQLGPAGYGGAVIDNQAYVLNLYGTGPVPAGLRARVEAMTGPPFRANMAQGKYSLAELRQLRSLIDELMATAVGAAINGAYTDVATNKVHVVLTEGAPVELLNRIASLIPADAVEFGGDVSFFGRNNKPAGAA